MYTLYIMKAEEKLTRTQIYLTAAQQERLARVSRGSTESKSALIRRAVDEFLERKDAAPTTNKTQRLQGLAGLWADRADLADPAAHLRQIRQARQGKA